VRARRDLCPRPPRPDGEGLWQDSDRRVALGHRRLAILDLSEAGAQPMHDPETGNVLVFNGEIYNFRALRRDLEQAGERFRSESDTEVLLALYRRDGAAMLPRLRGMFAFALWDAGRRGLLLARDPLGIKPLYWSEQGGTFRCASQVKALVAGGALPAEEDPAATVGFFLLGYVPDPHTALRGIAALEAGHSLWVDERGPGSPRPYFSFGENLAEAARRPPAQEASAALEESVRSHLVSDVPVAVFLSAGLDSSMLAAHASAAGGALHSVTLGFEELAGGPEDEVPLAARTAAALGSRHHSHLVPASRFSAALPHLLAAMDQPSIDGANSYLVAEASRCAGLKVALSGLGADELLGGYPSFRQVPACWSTADPGARPICCAGACSCPGSCPSSWIRSWFVKAGARST
jgi:asparagine synthase (glutamine-hydrolysing)